MAKKKEDYLEKLELQKEQRILEMEKREQKLQEMNETKKK